MRYWVARAKPALNEPFADWLTSERVGRWWTKRPPRTWDIGDRVFIWASSPQQQLLALGELAGLQTAPDEEGFYRYRLRYLTGVLSRPVERSILSSDPILSKSILLKYGPSTSVVRLTDDEGEQLYRLVVTQNPETKSVWPELLGRETLHSLSLPDPVYPSNDVASMESIDQDLDRKVKEARTLSPEERHRHLAESSKHPEKVVVHTTVFLRNQYVIAEVLARAKGVCESCHAPAPFIRASDNTPYLEVHHRIRLADRGEDSVLNAIALCPNCHRKAHYG